MDNYFAKIRRPGYKPSVLDLVEIKRAEIINEGHRLYERVRDGEHCILITLKDGSAYPAEMSDETFELFNRFLAAISQNDENFLSCRDGRVPVLPELFDNL